ncbi:hypothetical protein [uncultured Eudoraea sp.]|uniref:hypothetical protein n=1 Tax=uncultured Eudoraea sp. TaxID=1035614 RepID=UPI0026347AA7|nr:hypothetical protein [uncultured Eudoraea sp.]
MERKNELRIFSGLLWLLFTISFAAGTNAQQYIQKEYKTGQETTQSAVGINSVNGTTSNKRPVEVLYASTEQRILETMSPTARERAGLFVKLYNAYVSRAYYSLLKEAKKADQYLLEEYNYLLKSSKNRPDREAYNKELALAKLTYEAHWNMLEVLKSWNAFSAYGSDDLDLFKKEQIKNAYLMFRKGSSDSEIIDFLVYRLADLYYVQE